MRRSVEIAFVLLVFVLLVGTPSDASALVDDFEDDTWHPFTHYNLGDRAWAGYTWDVSRSGGRSFRVSIEGWAVRDFGSAYGYALYTTAGSPVVELRLSFLFESLADVVASPSDAYAAGLSLQLLDSGYRDLGTFRYIEAYRASANGGRCGPTIADRVLGEEAPLGQWQDLARSPAADFPSAPWSSARFVKVAAGFLCGAGLTGADYRMAFDSFAMQTGAGDTDRDGIEDLEEEARMYAYDLENTSVATPVPSAGTAFVNLTGPAPSGVLRAAGIDFTLSGADPYRLSVALETRAPGGWESHLLWDPGFEARDLAITSPAQQTAVRGPLTVRGGSADHVAAATVEILADGAVLASGPRAANGSFAVTVDTDALPEGLHALVARTVGAPKDSSGAPWTSAPVEVRVDRTPPSLALRFPAERSTIGGFVVLEAAGADEGGVDQAALWVDGARFDVLRSEPYAFAYDTADVGNGVHRFEVALRDAAGNEARAVRNLTVSNLLSAPPRPCFPTCNRTSGNALGGLSGFGASGSVSSVVLPSGNVLRLSESMSLPWHPTLGTTSSAGVGLLDLLRGPEVSEERGLVSTDLTAQDFVGADGWRLAVRNADPEATAVLSHAVLRLVLGTLAGVPDTDGDGLPDGEEHTSGLTSPVVADRDYDGLPDGIEVALQARSFVIDGVPGMRSFRTDPSNFDTDKDGLLDGAELHPAANVSASDPSDEDTDADGLPDGAEVLTFGSDPTRTDTDSDTLADAYEVTPHPLELVVNGTLWSWEVSTSPTLADTDGDGLSDPEEWSGANGTRPVTSPVLDDTDADGLKDREEVANGTDGFVTSPVDEDTDRDGVWDALDRLPVAGAQVAWEPTFPAGLIRFEQEFLVLSMTGLAAVKYQTYDNGDGTSHCEPVSNDVAGSTKSSTVNEATILAAINGMFASANETRFTALSAVGGDPSWHQTGTFDEAFGICGTDPAQFYILYRIDRDAYRVSFQNLKAVNLTDDEGVPFIQSAIRVSFDDDKPLSLVLQFSLPASADRSAYGSAVDWTAPALAYSLFDREDLPNATLGLSGIAYATELNDHAYQGVVRLSTEVLRQYAIAADDGTPYVLLYVSPEWVGEESGNRFQRAMETSGMRFASVSKEKAEEAYDLIVPLDYDGQEALLADVETLLDGSTGMHLLHGANVYVLRASDASGETLRLPENTDAVLIVGDSEADVYGVRSQINWTTSKVWYKVGNDPFGAFVREFRDAVKLMRSAVVAAQFLQMLSYAFVPPGTYVVSADSQDVLVVEKSVAQGDTIYSISQATSERRWLMEIDGTGCPLVRASLSYRVTASEITTDVLTSKILMGRYTSVRIAVRNLAGTGILVVNGNEAAIAFINGDYVRASIYSSNAALGLLGLYKGTKTLERLSPVELGQLGRLRLGQAAVLASGALLTAYEMSLAATSPDALGSRLHYERAAANALDSLLLFSPITAQATIVWGVTTVVLSFAMPNKLAAKITSSPGTTAVFLFEYFFSSVIPAEVAKQVLDDAIGLIILTIREYNGTLREPAVPVLP